MLNSKKSSKNNSKSVPGNSPSVNILSEGTKLTGDISSKTDVRIAGGVNGEAQSDGKIILTGSGKVIGNISSKGADIAGKVEGEIRVSAKLTLRKSAVIEGDIYTKTLIVEEGAQINGLCRMGENARKISSQNTATPSQKMKVKEAP
ncbi:MAG: polymer-forming cytoskeletal protein [Balneolaceae bacterium]|nr:polymer-forming cytoskeletal protein [Balneolaceae bacterium]